MASLSALHVIKTKEMSSIQSSIKSKVFQMGRKSHSFLETDYGWWQHIWTLTIEFEPLPLKYILHVCNAYNAYYACLNRYKYILKSSKIYWQVEFIWNLIWSTKPEFCHHSANMSRPPLAKLQLWNCQRAFR